MQSDARRAVFGLIAVLVLAGLSAPVAAETAVTETTSIAEVSGPCGVPVRVKQIVEDEPPAASSPLVPAPAAQAPNAAAATDAAPGVVDLYAIVRALAPGHAEAFGDGQVPPSVDLDIRFETGSAALSADSTAQLEALGGALADEALADARFCIAGHTDARGAEAYNQDLSERRAAAVAAYLVDHLGVDPARLETTGYGESRLKDPANPSSGVNRRVEVTLLAPPPEPGAEPEPSPESEPTVAPATDQPAAPAQTAPAPDVDASPADPSPDPSPEPEPERLPTAAPEPASDQPAAPTQTAPASAGGIDWGARSGSGSGSGQTAEEDQGAAGGRTGAPSSKQGIRW